MHCHPEDRPTQTLRIADLETALDDVLDIVEGLAAGELRVSEMETVRAARKLLAK